MSVIGIVNKNEFIVGGKYRLMRKIGSGSFGDIYLGINVSNGEVRNLITSKHHETWSKTKSPPLKTSVLQNYAFFLCKPKWTFLFPSTNQHSEILQTMRTRNIPRNTAKDKDAVISVYRTNNAKDDLFLYLANTYNYNLMVSLPSNSLL